MHHTGHNVQAANPPRNANRPLRNARTVWLKIHLYLGLTAGAVLALTGLSGSILVFQDRIDQALHPALLTARADGARASLDAVVQSVAREFHEKPVAIALPRSAEAVHVLHLPSDDGRLRFVAVDPATAAILGERTWGSYPVSIVYELHQRLLLGSKGVTLVGCLAVLVIVSVITGLYLWWPRGRLRLPNLLRAFSFKWTRNMDRLNYDLHRVAGAYVAVVLLLAATTALYFVFPSQISTAVNIVFKVRPDAHEPVSLRTTADTLPITLARLQQLIPRQLEGATPTLIYLPADAGASYKVRYRAVDEVFTRYGQSFAWFDQYTGNLLLVQDYRSGGRGDRLLAWLLPLHTGEAAGIAGRMLIFLAGMIPTLLYITGFYVWIRRRRPRRT